jgi:TolB-like protein/Tfp pilus assembly protein PilF
MGSPEERAKVPDDVPAEAELKAAVPGAADPLGAVFLSYASQDAEAARKISDALRSAGIEVWFDQSELRGGDAWDHSIRKQIKASALFIPVISRHTHDRDEGYFRLEWRLAVDRCRLMADDKAFLLPVVVDDTRDDDERVPERFREVQWTRLPGGNTPVAFVERVKRLLAPQPSTSSRPAMGAMQSAPGVRESIRPSWRSKAALAGIIAVLGAVAVYLLVARPWLSKQSVAPPTTATASAPSAPVNAASFAPPPHSIAVLPFVNMSGDKEQDYFSDGLSEELLNDLARINELQVAARTSAFSFKGKDTDIGTIARKLNVGSVLEGSVRRSAHTIRVTAQLNNAVTGFHIWSQTYDRALGDVLQLQTEIASAVAAALKVTLLGDVSAKIELGGTRNPAAFDAYLRGSKADSVAHSADDYQVAIDAYTEAIHSDPTYAKAFAARARARYSQMFAALSPDYKERQKGTESDARQALALAPDLAEGHLALARFFEFYSLDYAKATQEHQRALALAPGNAQVLREYGLDAVFMGRPIEGTAAARRALVLDPLNRESYEGLGSALYFGRNYDEAIRVLQQSLTLDPDDSYSYALLGLAYYALGDSNAALASCLTRAAKAEYEYFTQPCLAVAYNRLGRHADAERELAREKSMMGDGDAYQYALVYAQWGDAAQALDSLEKAHRLKDSGLRFLKTDPLLDPLRNEPRFQAIKRELKFPD